MEIGAQLYTVRDSMKTLEDFSETLKKVADIGYKYVQVSGTCEYEPEWLDAELKKNGLKCVLTHRPGDEIANETEKTIQNHNVFDCRYIGIGFYNFEENSIEQFYNTFKAPAEKIKQSGKMLMYHNHFNEFEKINGKYLLDMIGEVLPKDELGFTFDTYWAQAAGSNPIEWIKRLNGRIPVIHLKDMNYRGKMETVGQGNIDFETLLKESISSGTEYAVVENDWPEIDPFESLKLSFEYLKSLGY